MKRWHSLRSRSSSVWGRTLSRTKKPSSRNLRTCSVVICGAETAIGLFSLVADDHRICGERRYELAQGTLTWLFPGQDHVLVDESADHVLWWAVFRPPLVARIATTRQARRLLEEDPVGQFSR